MNVNNGGNNQTILGTAVGAGVGYGAYKGSLCALSLPSSVGIIGGFKKLPQYHDDFLKIGEKIIEDKKLPIKIVSPEQVSKELKWVPKRLRDIIYLPLLPWLKKQYKNSINSTKKGLNAFFSAGKGVVCVNKEKFTSPIFHELGHAINHYKGGFWSKIKSLKLPARVTAIYLLGVALLTPKKTGAAKENQGVIGKVATFIKENVGKLSVLAMLPFLAEELKASQIGNNLAKKYLSGDALKSVIKTNKLSAISYTSGVAIIGLSAFIANKVRDKVAALVDKKSK